MKGSDMKTGNYVHCGFGDFLYLGKTIGIFNHSQEKNRTRILTDKGELFSTLRSRTIISRVAGSKGG